MASLDELNFSVGAVERAKHAVYAVAWIAKDMADVPIVETLDNESPTVRGIWALTAMIYNKIQRT